VNPAAGITPETKPLPHVRREALFGQLQAGGAGLYLALTRRWKYVYSAADRREYLIDKLRDPGETTNVAYNVHCRDALLSMRERAAGHFPELAGTGFDTANVPLALGAPDEAETLAVIARDPDGGFLTIPDDDVAPDETFAEYRTRYREGEKS